MDDKIINQLEEIQQIKKDLKEITQWPWKWVENGYDSYVGAEGIRVCFIAHSGFGMSVENEATAKFIAKAPQVIADLIKIIESFHGDKNG